MIEPEINAKYLKGGLGRWLPIYPELVKNDSWWTDPKQDIHRPPYVEQAFRVWSVAGGPAAVVDAIHDRALAAGAIVVTGTRVVQVTTAGSRVEGVRLDDGRHLPADVVVSDVGQAAADADLLPTGHGLPAARAVDRGPLGEPDQVRANEMTPLTGPSFIRQRDCTATPQSRSPSTRLPRRTGTRPSWCPCHPDPRRTTVPVRQRSTAPSS